MDCQKLSREACAQNGRLPDQTVVQVLYYEQQRLRDVMDGSQFVATELLAPSKMNHQFSTGTVSLLSKYGTYWIHNLVFHFIMQVCTVKCIFYRAFNPEMLIYVRFVILISLMYHEERFSIYVPTINYEQVILTVIHRY